MTEQFYIINLESFQDDRGELFSILNNGNLPFEIKRIYFIRATENSSRANLSHKTQEQILICTNGQCSVLIDNGTSKQTILLDSPNKALFINKLIWRKIYNFSKDSVLLSLNSENHDENEIIRNYNEFLNIIKKETE